MLTQQRIGKKGISLSFMLMFCHPVNGKPVLSKALLLFRYPIELPLKEPKTSRQWGGCDEWGGEDIESGMSVWASLGTY